MFLVLVSLVRFCVQMEDEGNHGNDETRLFILSSLAQHQKSRVSCVLCEEPMFVFDRYPLVDGTFFLSPKQHAPGCIEVGAGAFILILINGMWRRQAMAKYTKQHQVQMKIDGHTCAHRHCRSRCRRRRRRRLATCNNARDKQ